MHRSVHRSPYGPRRAFFGDDGSIAVYDQPMSTSDASADLPSINPLSTAIVSFNDSPASAPAVTYSPSDYDASAQGQIQTEMSYQQFAQNYVAQNPSVVKDSSSTVSDVTKGLLGVVTAGGQIANTAIQNETVASLLRSRGLPVPASRPAPSSGPSVGVVVGVLGAIGLAVWGLSRS